MELNIRVLCSFLYRITKNDFFIFCFRNDLQFTQWNDILFLIRSSLVREIKIYSLMTDKNFFVRLRDFSGVQTSVSLISKEKDGD